LAPEIPLRDGANGYIPDMAVASEPAPDVPHVEVRRSKRRRRTVSAYRDGDRIVVLVPASLSRKEEAEWVETMVARVQKSERRTPPSDAELMERALLLNDRYLGGLAVPGSVRWVENQKQRWGSCTPGDRTIRLSSRLRGMPQWVIDYVLVHELAHLLEPGHDARFWAWVARYPHAEKAKGYLLGWSAAAHLEPPPDEVD
jgi:predicted metal-dependent hydrolase